MTFLVNNIISATTSLIFDLYLADGKEIPDSFLEIIKSVKIGCHCP